MNFAMFYDLETTGTEEALDGILEIGALLVDLDQPGQVISEFERRVSIGAEQIERLNNNPVVLEMHTKSGLLTDNAIFYSNADVEAQAIEWLEHYTQGKKHIVPAAHIVPAGSGVSHFDGRFLRYRMPLLARRLYYWALDVGVLRRACQFAGRDDLILPGTGLKKHRALDDARFHHQEWLHYRAILAGAMLPVPEDALVEEHTRCTCPDPPERGETPDPDCPQHGTGEEH